MAELTHGKLMAAYQNGRMDFHAGAPCDPKVPKAFVSGLSSLQASLVKQAWADGWLDAFVNGGRAQDAPGGMPHKGGHI